MRPFKNTSLHHPSAHWSISDAVDHTANDRTYTLQDIREFIDIVNPDKGSYDDQTTGNDYTNNIIEFIDHDYPEAYYSEEMYPDTSEDVLDDNIVIDGIDSSVLEWQN